MYVIPGKWEQVLRNMSDGKDQSSPFPTAVTEPGLYKQG